MVFVSGVHWIPSNNVPVLTPFRSLFVSDSGLKDYETHHFGLFDLRIRILSHFEKLIRIHED